jgi:hypothetical protein
MSTAPAAMRTAELVSPASIATAPLTLAIALLRPPAFLIRMLAMELNAVLLTMDVNGFSARTLAVFLANTALLPTASAIL